MEINEKEIVEINDSKLEASELIVVDYDTTGLTIKNYNETKEKVDIILNQLNNLPITVDNLAVIKKHKANLNNFKGALSRVRIDTKKKVLADYTNFFLPKFAIIENAIEATTDKLKNGIEEIEEEERQKRKDILEEEYSLNPLIMHFNNEDHAVPFSVILDEDWISKDLTKKVKSTIQEKIDRIQGEINSIIILNRNDIKQKYFETLSLTEAMSLLNQTISKETIEAKEEFTFGTPEQIKQSESNLVNVSLFLESLTNEKLNMLYKFMNINNIHYSVKVGKAYDDDLPL